VRDLKNCGAGLSRVDVPNLPVMDCCNADILIEVLPERLGAPVPAGPDRVALCLDGATNRIPEQ
jgi:hypothetical protein